MKRAQGGATAVEFALVLLIFLMFLLAVIDFSRLLFTWNAATEATRAGARFAVVCDDTGQKDLVLAKMQAMLPEIGDVALAWSPGGCDASTCEGVTVTITSLNFRWISPIVGAAGPLIALPTFSTYLPREVMRQGANATAICNS
jgi:Flp pilus assembly protein TadG